jgi:RNA polymerase sigma-70 factor (ECF subfamily)
MTLAKDIGFSLKTQKKTRTTDVLPDLADIRKSQNGDKDAFGRLVKRYQKHVSRLLWRFTRDCNTHEELVQECFVQAYLSLRTYRARAPFEHWISRIATRVGYRHWKQCNRHSHVSLLDKDWQQMSQAHTDSMNPQQAAELVHILLAKLPHRDRLVLTLRYLEQCSVEETARRTGWSISLVKVQTYRAKQKLKKLLENTDIDVEDTL